jgi:ABC-type nitrate/sulfonate/bicarbonate transport system substrate-binding protein/outer membrane protein OmpA-like peptidoglycan-associated protein
MSSRPKPLAYVIGALVIAALFWFGASRIGGGRAGGSDAFSKDDIAAVQGQAEAPDANGVTTSKEYNFVPAARLPEVKGSSAYTPMADRTVRMALNVWAGWAPLIYANGGMKAGRQWRDAQGKPFKVELVLIDDPVQMRDAVAAGNVHIGWATLDMLPLFIEGLKRDSRTMPRVFQQVDFSNGGDGIVVRQNIKSVSDLRGKTCVLAQNSPSQYFLMNTLLNGGVQPGEVNMKYTQDAFQAAAAFNADKTMSCVVSWAPDIYNLEKVPGNRMLVTTQTANKLIADVWWARADFAKDHPAILEGMVRGIFDAMETLKADSAKGSVAKFMADGYSIPEADARGMLGDAHWTNFAENREFFMNQNNPANFERTWNNAYFIYKRLSVVGDKVPFDQVMDFTILQKLSGEQKYAAQKDEYQVQFVPTTASAVQAEKSEILTKTVVIQFFPNSDEIEKMVVGPDGKEKAYDPNVPITLEEIGRLAGQYGASRIIIEGHTDASMRGQVDPAAVKELSMRRANAVKQALVRKFKTLQPNQFVTAGMGWDRPADLNDPQNSAKNRRVEIKVYPLEAVAQ